MVKLWHKIWDWIKPYLTAKMIPIILSVWCITNGIWYIMAFAPIAFIPNWLSGIAKGYIVFLWTPFGIEKPIIIAVSLFIYKKVYKKKFKEA